MEAKKSLGQNFLKSESILRKITEAGDIQPNDVILEIGPGRGALTKQLLTCSNHVIAVEKDYELFKFLQEKFTEEIKLGSLTLVHDDILDFDCKAYSLEPGTYKIIANIPYNITGAILKKFLAGENQPISMILMVQHEVATRILAKDGKESLLSISVKAYGEPKLVAKIDKRFFSPSPKVNSAIISIKNISRKVFMDSQIKEERFWEMLKQGFAHKRKKVASNLKNLLKEESASVASELKDKRAEDLSLSDWISLSKQWYN